MNVEECVRDGLLLPVKPDKAKALRSLELAEEKLARAGELFSGGFFDEAVVTAYTAMFHTARALLFKDGYKERSHYALAVYAREKYGDKIERKYLNELDALRMQRHDVMYGLEERPEVKEVEAESAISVAAGFLAAVKKLL